MHESAMAIGEAVASFHGGPGTVVVDVGGRNVNGSLRSHFEKTGSRYICIDMEDGEGVDIVVPPGDPFPFDTATIDVVVSTSCFEHDPCFWLTFREMARVIRMGGIIYVNAPTKGNYHCHPGDNWRFYSDAGQALAYWSGKQLGGMAVYPVKLVETFHSVRPAWCDFVALWIRVDTPETTIVTPQHVRDSVGPVQSAVRAAGFDTVATCSSLVKYRLPQAASIPSTL
jgi:SAM-dependent methyltransferase